VPFADCFYIISCHDQEVKKFFLVFLKFCGAIFVAFN